MEFKSVGGIKLPALGVGTWWVGGKEEPDFSEDKQSIAAIRRGVEMGMTHIDTAEYYGKGHAEELVNEAVKDFPREKLFIASKVWKTNLAHDDVLAHAEKSLKRLKTDYLDLYMPHWPNSEIPIAETMKAMDQLVEEKKVRYLGLSNYSLAQMKEAQAHTKNKIVAAQIRYNLHQRDAEKDIIPYCQAHNMFAVAYRPLDKSEILSKHAKPLGTVAERVGKTPAQVALNWIISHPNVVGIVKSVHVERMEENAMAAGWKLSAEDIARLESDIKSQPTPISLSQLFQKK